MILAGDLNATPESVPLVRFREAWTIASGERATPTFPAVNPLKTIDYVMIRRPGRLRASMVRVIDEPVASDHRPILAVFESTQADGPKPSSFTPYTKPTLIAHRGTSGEAPEHTLIAYELALTQGAEDVEPDLQITNYGVLACLHDTTLNRTTNGTKIFPDRTKVVKGGKTWPVADLTFAEIKTLDAGSWKGVRIAEAKVLAFQEMIDLVKGKAGIIPETKAPEV